MKCIVVKRFNDKNTKEFYKLNKIIEVSDERYEEIKEFVKLFEETVKKSDRRKGKELEKEIQSLPFFNLFKAKNKEEKKI